MSKLQDYGRQELADFIENAAVGLHWIGPDGIIQWANRAELNLLGYSAKEYIGRHIAEFHLDKDVIDNILTRVSGNETLHNCEARLRRKDGSICYALISSTPYRENGKFIHTRCFTRDITERRNAEDALIEKAKLLAFAASISETLIQRGTLERDLNKCAQLVVEHLGGAFARIWTLNEEENVLELQASAGMYTHLDGLHSRVPVGQFKIGLIAQERRPHLTNAVLDDPQVSDQEWARREGMAAFAGYPLIVDDRLVGVIAVFARHQLTQDALEALASVANNLALGIDQERTEQALREQTEIIETVNRLGRLLSAELDLQKLAQALTDAATQITGAQFGSFFYNVLDDRGASYMLYSLSGVPFEHFAHFPMPRATDLFGPTFRGEGTIRIADVKQDHRYGKNSPYFGMPVGHLPVTSYLAVPVVSRSGEVIGGLFFGHSEAGVFTPQIERIIEGLAAQAAVSIDNARLYESQKKSRAEAEDVSRMKDVFLATVSHELRTPLNAILGWASLLRTGRVEGEEANRALNIIENNARLQNQLITDLLDVSRIITGKMRLDIRPIDLTAVIEAAVETVRPSANAKSISLQVVMDPGAASVMGDFERLQQVVWNLLSNAIKFTPKDGSVKLLLQRANSHVEIVVQDSGIGINPAFLQSAFDRFRQQDSSSTRMHGGLGLGLAIVRHLAELHGGTAHVYSQGEGQGSTFTIKLPLMASHIPTQTEEDSEHPAASSENILAANLPLIQGVRVLVVDDEPSAREIIVIILEQSGAEVKAVSSVAEAFEALPKWKPDVLLSDIQMPGEDGYCLISKVRANEKLTGEHLPAAALTAYTRTQDRLNALSAGFEILVPKPVEPAELITVVASLAKRIGCE